MSTVTSYAEENDQRSAEHRPQHDQLVSVEIGLERDATVHLEAPLSTEHEIAIQVMTTMGQGLAVTNAAGMFEYVNPAYAHLVGLPLDALIGRSAYDFTPPSDHATLHAARDARQQGATIAYEAHLQTTAGASIPVLITTTPRLMQGAINGAITVITDITRQKQLEWEREQLLRQVQSSLVRTEALYQITQAAIGTEPVAAQLERIVQITAEALGANRVTLITLDVEREAVTHFVCAGDGMDHVITVDFAELMRGLTGWVMQTGLLAFSPKGSFDPREEPDVAARRAATDCGAILVAPLSYRGRILGTLTAINTPDQPDFTAADGEIMLVIAHQIANVLIHAQLLEDVQRAAITDALTGVHNRRGWFTVVQPLWEYAQRQQQALAILMLDVDHFKRVNDTYGHPVGDTVLQVLAARCRESIRSMDVLGRYGGEEFVTLLPATDQHTGRIIAERIRTAIVSSPIATAAGSLPLTISIGVALWTPDVPNLELLVERADQALYHAKRCGRNQACVWEAALSPHP